MPPEHRVPCPHCRADIAIQGARAFTPTACPACGAMVRARTDFAGYRIGDPIARSGLAVLFQATDPVTGVEFALKLIQPPFGTEPEDLGRFVADARAVAALDHPHCARVFGAGVEEGLAWIAMELLTGGSLAGRLAAVKRLGEVETLTYGLQAASALAAADAAGVSHHDLEPNNLVFDEAGTLKITDFGQAVFYERVSSEVGIIWGRPAFVAPERLARSEEDSVADIYGFGATLFCALTGSAPYDGEAHGQILFDRMSHEPIRVENHVRPIHAGTAAVLNRMLSASRARRFQSWAEAIEGLSIALAELTGRAAPPPATPHPAPAPSPRNAAAAKVAAPALPASAKAPAPVPSTSGSLLTLVMLGVIVCASGFFAWKQWRSPVPTTAVSASKADQAILHETTPPPGRHSEVVKPAATPVAGKVDWSGWRTARLEASARKGSVKGRADVIPGSGALRMRGNSTGIDGTQDECVFHYGQLGGDWTLTARVASREGVAGLVARKAIGSDQPMLAIWIAADGKIVTGIRRKAGAKAEISKPVPAARVTWLKIMRRGNVFGAHFSPDGETWKAIVRQDADGLPDKVPAGFAVWSGTGKRAASATFDNVGLTTAR